MEEGSRNDALLFTPHARGSTILVGRGNGKNKVYPACAGIDRHHNLHSQFQVCLPRMRGDRPYWLPRLTDL